MGTKEKLIARFKSNPKDFTWDEFVRLFSILGYEIDNKGKVPALYFLKGKFRILPTNLTPGIS